MIDESVPMEDILNSVKKVKTPLLKSVSLFDIYRDTKNMEDKKSYGLRFQFLHTDRTLKDKEVDKIMQSIQKNISESVNASFR
jgi:phenylalanyl-tRNA synthetase beta chain